MKEQRDMKKRAEYEEPIAEAAQSDEAKVGFLDWFAVQLKSHPKLKSHHHGMILAFFKNNNLTEQEPASAYAEMLTNFGF